MIVCRCRFGQQNYTFLSLTTCSPSAKIPRHPWVQEFQSVMGKQHEWHSKKKCLFFSGSSLVKITIMKDRLNKLYAPLTMKWVVVGIQWWLRSGSSLHLEVLVLILACSKDFGRVSNWCRSFGEQSCIWSGSTCRKAVNRMQTLVWYVGVTRLVFHGLQLLPIRFTLLWSKV